MTSRQIDAGEENNLPKFAKPYKRESTYGLGHRTTYNFDAIDVLKLKIGLNIGEG